MFFLGLIRTFGPNKLLRLGRDLVKRSRLHVVEAILGPALHATSLGLGDCDCLDEGDGLTGRLTHARALLCAAQHVFTVLWAKPSVV